MEDTVRACRELWARAPARFADGWSVNPVDLPRFADSVALLRERFETHDRDPDSQRSQVSIAPVVRADGSIDLGATGRTARRYAQCGATVVVFRPSAFGLDADRLPALLDWMVGLSHD